MNPNESRGTDTKFGKDAIVLIIAKVSTYSEYLQMLGRGSRSRGVSNGILYSTSDEKPNVLIQRLKKGSITVALELEKLLNLLKQKSNNRQLIEILKQQQENG